VIDGVEEIPDIVGHTAVLLDLISEENRVAKESQKEAVMQEEAVRAKRAEANDALYREWAG
jgi:hypothetical protein